MCSWLTSAFLFWLALTECTSTIRSQIFLFLHARNTLNSHLLQVCCKMSRLYFECSDGTFACTDCVLRAHESVEPGKAERWETSPYKVLLLSHVIMHSFSLSVRLSRRVSFMRMWESSRRLLLLLPRGFHQRRGSSAGKRARSTTWVTTPSPTLSESLTPS